MKPRNQDLEEPSHFSGKSIYAEVPVYKIRINNTDNYKKFVQNLKNEFTEIVDLDKKINFDDTHQTIFIFYYPRILKSLMSIKQMYECFHQFLDDGEYHGKGSVRHNPYDILKKYLTDEFRLQNKNNFTKCVTLYDSYIKSANVNVQYLQPTNSVHILNSIPHSIFDNFESEYIGLGESHHQKNSYKLIMENLSFLEQCGITVLFLEGIPYEAQELLDHYLASSSNQMSKELKAILKGSGMEKEKTIELITEIKAKKVNIRVVGLDNCSSYLADESHDENIEWRVKAFNYIAFKIMQETRSEGKKMFLVGSQHLKISHAKTPGLASFLKCPSVVVCDNLGSKATDFCTIPGIFFHDKKIKHQFEQEFSNSYDKNKRYFIYETDALAASDYVLMASPEAKMSLDRLPSEDHEIKLSSSFNEKIYKLRNEIMPTQYKNQSSFSSSSIFSVKNTSLSDPLIDNTHSVLARKIDLSEEKLYELEAKLTSTCQKFISEEREKRIKSQPSGGIDSESAYQLYGLMRDPQFGKAYVMLLLANNPEIISPGSWGEIAKISIDHAKLIFSDKGVPDKIIFSMIKSRFLAEIGQSSPEHARLILERFGDHLGDQKEVVEYHAKYDPSKSNFSKY